MASHQIIFMLMLLVYLSNGRRSRTHFEDTLGTLKLVHVLFRHGDRTQTNNTYPNDPYANDTFYPNGIGHLTTPGKIREYDIGTYLRQTYGDFLGDTYFPDILEAATSPTRRCQTSLQIVLAALFPPSSVQRWNRDLNWQPIHYDYLPVSQDMIFWSAVICSKCKEHQWAYENSTIYQEAYKPYAEILDYLQEKSGIESRVFLGASLYSTLRSQEDYGLELPPWTKLVWPEPISAITKLDWQHSYPTKETRALSAGFMMSKILNDTQLTLNGDSSVINRKLYLYSGHDKNIAAMLSWLGFAADMEIPQYGAFIIFEVYTNKDIPSLRIIHQNYDFDTPQVIDIPGCGSYCPLNKFIELYSEFINPYEICNN